MRTSLTLLVVLALYCTAGPLTATTDDAAQGPNFIEVRCTDPSAPAGWVVFDVDMVNGGIDEPMTWTKQAALGRRLVNAWRLRLGNGEVVVTTQPCDYDSHSAHD